MFIPVTHYYSGERMFIPASIVTLIREKEGKTLIVADRGMYVTEDAVLIKDMIEAVLLTNNVSNKGMMKNVQEKEETKE
ncbi:hypothetical protein AAXB25_14420 [Paenibacillus lautus]|uniref:hypothetical protein n=1 Tax=Paenibacillus lautus TaxID=1401 RepID=UPI003D2A3768